MKYIPLLFVFLTGGCAVSMDKLIVEARECVDQSTNLQGVIGATEEQRSVCWIEVNKRLESQAKRDAARDLEEANRCPGRMVKVCDWKGCGCIKQWQMQEILRRGY